MANTFPGFGIKTRNPMSAWKLPGGYQVGGTPMSGGREAWGLPMPAGLPQGVGGTPGAQQQAANSANAWQQMRPAGWSVPAMPGTAGETVNPNGTVTLTPPTGWSGPTAMGATKSQGGGHWAYGGQQQPMAGPMTSPNLQARMGSNSGAGPIADDFGMIDANTGINTNDQIWGDTMRQLMGNQVFNDYMIQAASLPKMYDQPGRSRDEGTMSMVGTGYAQLANAARQAQMADLFSREGQDTSFQRDLLNLNNQSGMAMANQAQDNYMANQQMDLNQQQMMMQFLSSMLGGAMDGGDLGADVGGWF